MNKELAKYFFEQASSAFDFLVREHSFARPKLYIDKEINFAFVTFMGKNLAIECILDEREEDVDCKVVRVFKGKKSSHYDVDENGLLVRDALPEIFVRRGVRERLFHHVGHLQFRERIPILLGDFSLMLKKHGQDIMNDSATVFPQKP